VELFSDPEFWVGVGFAIVIAGFVYLGVPKMVNGMLDARAASIAKELDDARRLREEAAALLAQYKQKTSGVEKEAAAILTEAKAEAERFGVESRAQLKLQMERRAKAAQEKIAQAEVAAIAEIRALAADAAVSAAEKLIAARLDERRAADLVKRSLEEIPSKLN
jgi:F-type H+-transporting ATPase subunit b